MHLLRAERCAAAVILAFSFLLSSPPAAVAANFGGYRPHYQGFGVKTRGGRGGAIYRVTRLDDDNKPGSFRHALLAREPRIVIFETSGTIALRSPISVTSPYLTIAGQTAPSPGITIRDADVRINTHDVVVQHLRFRLGDAGFVSNADTFDLRCDVYNVVLDHVSLSWGVDETLAFHRSGCLGAKPKDISVLDSIVSETLWHSLNAGGPHSRAFLVGGNVNGTATVARTLIANNYERNPTVQPGWRLMWINNVTYNPAVKFMWYLGGHSNGTPYADQGAGTWPYEVVHVGSLGIPGPNTAPQLPTIAIQAVPSSSRFFFADNVGYGMTSADQWAGVEVTGRNNPAQLRLTAPPSWYTAFKINPLPNGAVEAYVLANAGARPLDRDSVDTRIVQEVRTRKGKVINSPREVGGWPVLAKRTRALTPPSNPNQVVDGVGRTAIEAWLETMAQSLEPRTTVSQAAPKPATNLRLLQ